ncbi:type IV toxin-antitoxin system AbiEi family antitoxin domain-containing protein [Arthrobacter woluwensis]|uniref:type IV toxin-antitoxin system AbiEi family antitoxin domain-containing protein n=1 Tax=Arthrobacter woluwensis TaxID=156980 RepID=UPI00381E5E08
MFAEDLAALGRVAGDRWGLVTTSQAEAEGVSRLRVSRLAAKGFLIPVQRGVYRILGAPEQEHEAIIASWLNLGGDTAEPSPSGAPGLVVAGVDATILHQAGDFYPEGHEYIAPRRKTSRRPDVRIRIEDLTPEDITRVDALPVLTIEKTVADLLASWMEKSLVVRVVRDATLDGRLVRPHQLPIALDPIARRHGFDSGLHMTQWLFDQAGIQPLGRLAA